MICIKGTDLDNIKGTEQVSTEPPFKGLVRLKCTEKRLAECASTSKYSTRIKGSNAETVALQYFEKHGAQLICRNLPTIFSEVDLVLLSAENEILLVEVKLVDHDELIFAAPVKRPQMLRLKRLLVRWQESVNKSVRLHLAAVNHRGEVIVFEDFLL